MLRISRFSSVVRVFTALCVDVPSDAVEVGTGVDGTLDTGRAVALDSCLAVELDSDLPAGVAGPLFERGVPQRRDAANDDSCDIPDASRDIMDVSLDIIDVSLESIDVSLPSIDESLAINDDSRDAVDIPSLDEPPDASRPVISLTDDTLAAPRTWRRGMPTTELRLRSVCGTSRPSADRSMRSALRGLTGT